MRIYLLISGCALQNFFLNKFLLIFSKKYVESVEIDYFYIQDREQLEVMKENVFWMNKTKKNF